MSLEQLFDNPQRSLSIIAVTAVLGIVAMGVIGFYVKAQSAELVAAVQKTLEAVLIAAAGAKAGLAMPGNKQP